MKLEIRADFDWDDKYHGNVAESFWIWVEDPDSHHTYHYEFFAMPKKQVSYPDTVITSLLSPLRNVIPCFFCHTT